MEQVIRVLMVEDNPGDATLIKVLLSEARDAAFDVDVVGRLSEARRKINSESYDVLLLDLGLPDAHGIETLVLALEFAKGVPIVVLTGSRTEGLGVEAARIGAQDYLVKGEANADAVERSLLYSIERRKAQIEVQHALQTYADLVREIPSGIMTFQYEEPRSLTLLSWNPQACEILGKDVSKEQSKDMSLIWPVSETCKESFLNVMRTGKAIVHKGGRFVQGYGEVALDLRAFRIPGNRLCISMDDVTDRIREEELRRKAYAQIETNIEHFASLVDEIRNPNSVIIGLAERMEGADSRCIMKQAERIENIVNRLDEQWMASENIRKFLHKTI